MSANMDDIYPIMKDDYSNPVNSHETDVHENKSNGFKITSDSFGNENRYKEKSERISKLDQFNLEDEIGYCLNCLNKSFVKRCITMDIIGSLPPLMYTRPFPAIHMKIQESVYRRQSSFNDIFHNSIWGNKWDNDSLSLHRSGQGSTLFWAQEVVGTLHSTMNTLKRTLNKSVIHLLDMGCGDMAWMYRFLITRDDVEYTGIDIVSTMISHHRKTFRNFKWKFYHYDILTSSFINDLGSFDIVISRMVLQHLYNVDVMKTLNIISESNIKYALMTTFATNNYNRELSLGNNPGRFHEVNLEIPPYSLSPPLCLERDEPSTNFIEPWKHFIGLWKLPLLQISNCAQTYKLRLKGTHVPLYSCIPWTDNFDI